MTNRMFQKEQTSLETWIPSILARQLFEPVVKDGFIQTSASSLNKNDNERSYM